MQFHLDFMVDDLEGAEAAALALGATKFDEQPSPTDFLVYAEHRRAPVLPLHSLGGEQLLRRHLLRGDPLLVSVPR